VTDSLVGVIDGVPTLDGKGIVWFEDRPAMSRALGRAAVSEGDSSVPGGRARRLERGSLASPGDRARESATSTDSLSTSPSAEALCRGLSICGSRSHRSADEHGFCRGGLSADGSLLCLEHASMVT